MKYIAIVLGLVACTAIASAQVQKLSFVDSERIINDLPEAQAAQKDLEKTIKGWQDQLQKMSDDFQKAVTEYQKKEAVMAPAAKDAEQQRLQDMRQKALDFQNQKLGQNGEAQQLRDTKLAPIRDKILKAIEAVAKEEGFSFVFDKANDILLLYADSKYDLTYKVLDRLKRGSAKSTK